MGYENREYFREDEDDGDDYGAAHGFGGGWRDSDHRPKPQAMTPACKLIIILSIACFIGGLIFTRSLHESEREEVNTAWQEINTAEKEAGVPEGDRTKYPDLTKAFKSRVTDLLGLKAEQIFPGGQVWRLLTTAFCYEDLLKLIFYMLFFFLLGKHLEAKLGTTEFTFVLLATVVLSNVVFVALAIAFGSDLSSFGGGAAILTIVFLYAMRHSDQQLQFLTIPVKAHHIVIVVSIIHLLPVFVWLGGRDSADGLANLSHFAGMGFAFLYWKNDWQLSRFWQPIQERAKRARTVKPSIPKEDNLDKDVDAILAKISIEGEDSLTKKERKILEKASKRYQDRTPGE